MSLSSALSFTWPFKCSRPLAILSSSYFHIYFFFLYIPSMFLILFSYASIWPSCSYTSSAWCLTSFLSFSWKNLLPMSWSHLSHILYRFLSLTDSLRMLPEHFLQILLPHLLQNSLLFLPSMLNEVQHKKHWSSFRLGTTSTSKNSGRHSSPSSWPRNTILPSYSVSILVSHRLPEESLSLVFSL